MAAARIKADAILKNHLTERDYGHLRVVGLGESNITSLSFNISRNIIDTFFLHHLFLFFFLSFFLTYLLTYLLTFFLSFVLSFFVLSMYKQFSTYNIEH